MLQKDPTCVKEKFDKFIKYFREILSKMNIDEDQTNIIDAFTKVEVKLQELCDARNYLFKTKEKTIEQFEKDLVKERLNNLVSEQEAAKAHRMKLLEKMMKKQEKMEHMNLFKGMPFKARSDKVEWKSNVIKKDFMDE